MTFALRVRALWKSYAAGIAGCSARVWVLRGASLDVERGECVGVVGSRGAGTTTLLHCLAGLRRPDAGSIERNMAAAFVDSSELDRAPLDNSRLLLLDDGLALHRRARNELTSVRSDDATTIIATHELARVRDVADRVLLLHHGRLFTLDNPTEVRRVAERSAMARAIDQVHG